MDLAQAVEVRDGAYITSKFTDPPLKPVRVTKAWVNERQTIVRFRIHSLGDVWIDSTGCELPPKGKQWSEKRMRWE